MPAHLAMPLRVTTAGTLAALPQDSPDEVAQSVALLLATRPLQRLSVPEYGTPPVLGVGVDTTGISAALDAHEPRAAGHVITVTGTPAEPVVTVALPSVLGGQRVSS